MSGQTLAAASVAVDSAPDVLAPHGNLLIPPPSALRDAPDSLLGLEAFDLPSFDLASELERALGFTRNTNKLSLRPATATERTAQIESESASDNENGTASLDTLASKHGRSRSKSMIDRPLSWIPGSNSSPNVQNIPGHRPKRPGKQDVVGGLDGTVAEKPSARSRTVESFADFAKRSWISKSRSPSPPSKPEKSRAADRACIAERPAAPKTKATPGKAADDAAGAAGAAETPTSTSRTLSRATGYLTRIKQRPQSVFSRTVPLLSLRSPAGKSSALDDSDFDPSTIASHAVTTPTDSLAPSLPVRKNASHNSRNSAMSGTSSQRTSSVDTELETDATTASTTSENATQSTAETSTTTMPHPTSRDPLWTTFRTLDMEFSRFAAKNSTAARMAVVRSILVPFLRSTAYHPSNSNRSILTPEDIDRRATILNKWWNGLLGMLVGGNSRLPAGLGPAISGLGFHLTTLQPVAGVDRPTLLDATTMIMMRPEWRSCTSYFQPLADRCPAERVRPRSGTQSSTGSNSDSLLAESAEHNVRTMFVTNLTTQMSLAVEKLSLRHAPLSLVSWCGKACAYAFFFVPGVADVLVRLWGLNVDLLRRVADEFGLPRRSKGESEDIVALFPPHLHKLGWSSVKSLADKLRLAAKLPLMLAKIPWHGPWVARWRGRDTDLVFIFCKYFHILAQEFMPEGLPLVEKARAPAFVLVHAQLLSVLDSTIHRQATLEATLCPPLSDALHGADAALTAPQLPSNLMRGMDENRLIVLLKDMLAEHSNGVTPKIRHTFAEAFVAIARAAAKRTPRFEHAACFMLCDFLEEALVALHVFQNTVNKSTETSSTEEVGPLGSPELGNLPQPVSYIDWPFWFEVGKMIMDSNNTMSEIRIMSFIFSVWDAITADPVRKEALCLDWLLSEAVFARFFNHWCPMVRAYYMRLLCWRVCRDAGSANEVDIKIFLVVSQRLKTVWSHYLWLKQDAEAKGRVHPSTAPCYPAPGKRFLIIRTEVQPPQQPLRLGFDSFSSSLANPDISSGTSTAKGDGAAGGDKSDGSMPSFKKRWSLLGKVLPFTASQDSPTSPSKRTWGEELEQARRETAASRITSRGGPPGPPTPPKQGSSAALRPSSDSSSSTGSAPLFDAGTFVFRFTLTWQTGPGGVPSGPPRDRILTRPRLPAPAQARVSARFASQDGAGNVPGGTTFRSDSPPPIRPGLPPETWRVSGVWQTGLISEARNARPLSVAGEPRKPENGKPNDRRLSLNIDFASLGTADDCGNGDNRLDLQSPVRTSGFSGYPTDGARSPDVASEPGRLQAAPAVRAERPTGVYAANAVYTGRALAEWSIVVSECNSFVDRRRDEGVLGLSDVEVPMLSVEGLGFRPRG
ncbi:hypothetical protein VTK56DRAFT_4591 [Thermocarpiscus australiensis]